MIASKNRVYKDNSKKRANKEQQRLEAKSNSPGVPPITCTYIDMVINMIGDMQAGYERLRQKGDHQPMMDQIHDQASSMLELIRRGNETLRDNSEYWYNKYKDQLKKR